jgi:tetratricopeptide (TPR) repeat protein/thioredoxin-like negative regulator of GroEL
LPTTEYRVIKNNPKLRCLAFISIFVFFCLIALFPSYNFHIPSKAYAEKGGQELLDEALFVRQEFFGAEAIVPLPTAQARENAVKLAQREPDNPQFLEKLAELEEKLGNFDESERLLIRLAEIDKSKLENLAAFYDRRGRYEKEAEIIQKILFTTVTENRSAVFERLINFAKKHDLKEYLRSDFYARVTKENPNVYAIFEKLIDDFKEAGNYTEALNFARQAKALFPHRQSILLEKEVDILLETGNTKEAVAIYQAAFNPFWSDAEAEKFYDFLNNQDRLRAYGSELKNRFKQNPADFDAAIRLALYQNHDYSYGNDEITPVILKLEQAKKVWTTEELVTVTRLLLRNNEAEMASRFLYTLYVREDFKANNEMRAKILYQLFEMFSDAENRKLPITKGDLRFYEDVAKTDTSPGIATGILSLIFSDTNPKKRLDEQEKAATKYFNRAAAYRIFLEYKEEFPDSAELAQMYLDIVRLYTATNEPEIAQSALDEFAQRYGNSGDYPEAALKLADAFAAANNVESERQVYQKVLDYLGKQGKFFAPQLQYDSQTSGEFNVLTSKSSVAADAKATRNNGINIPDTNAEPDYYGEQQGVAFTDYLTRKESPVTYAEVLEKLVSSLAAEKKTAEILALYSNEIQKYPEQEWLYEQRLFWLEQTNLTDDQLQVYQSALARFQSRGWRDKLARWFLRQKRQTDFAEFSQELAGKLNDAEIQDYLSQFIDGKVSTDFEKQLFLKLYLTAYERFPHNSTFVEGLLRFYKTNKQADEWRKLAAKYYFESKNVREQFLEDLAEKGELRAFLDKANGESLIYELFRADVSERLSNYENAVVAYRKLNRLYPNTPDFSEKLISLTRSFGQKNRDVLTEAANAAHSQADFLPASAEARTRSGEIYAELGRYDDARQEWEKLISTAAGEKETYLDTATVYWDYFQYDDALRSIKNLRKKFADETLYAFEAGAILEAQHKQPEAVAEYVKALDASGADYETQKEKAQKRLVRLVSINRKAFAEINSAFQTESRRKEDSSFLVLGYAEFLTKIKQEEKAAVVLNASVKQSRNKAFLESAKDFYQTADNKSGEQTTLKRLAEIEESPRKTIAYRLQLAESFEEINNREAARTVLTELVNKFPTNYGVLIESSDFYYRLGFENRSVALLQNALLRSRGKYQNALAQKLANRLIRLNRLDSAEQVLLNLHDKDKANADIFGELAKVCVQTGKTELLRKTFQETVAALKQTEADRRELDEQIADLRERMIDAFTRLKDYKSAVEQHIEIINREPGNEQLIENAVSYVQRYGGAETLLDYYLKTSAESFKNYRWNIVLARIYAAKNDWDNAAKNYRAAIINQPEMAELYAALAEIEIKGNNFDEAIKNLNTILELTNDSPEYVKKKIEILKKAGRFAEAETEMAKLPNEETTKISTDQFAEARKLWADEKEKARELYREAFGKLLENPTSGELRSADITGYVQAAREEEPLDQINEQLWRLREKLIDKAEETNAADAGEARKRISILDRALTESVGTIAKTVVTDEELAVLHTDLQRRIEVTSPGSDQHQVLSLIQDISRRAGLGDLEEKILQKKLESSSLSADRQIYLQNLVNFYNERGAYQKTFDVLEQYNSDNPALKAETARLINDREKELEALRAIYWKGDKINTARDGNVTRYLEIIYAENREELKSLTEKSSPCQLQLINFLLGRGLTELAHSAIESANLPPVWKVSRHAETSLALKESGDTAACYFCEALQIDSIGNLVNQKPDKEKFLINDDWFRLSREYGEWLFENKEQSVPPSKFLVSMIENQPRSEAEQFKLGEFYLGRNQPKSAIEHFRLAVEMSPEDKSAWTSLGAAYYQIGKTDWAEESWARVVEGEDVGSGLILFQTLQKYGLSGKAREKMPAIINKFLQNNDAQQSEDFQHLIRAVDSSFKNESEKSAYFLQLLSDRPTDTSLAEMLINESLIEKREQNRFYELLIDRTDEVSGYDYDYNFTSVAARAWTRADAESIYEQENDYKIEEPDNEHFQWQKKYLELLIEQRENQKAEQLIAEIDKELNGRFVRPAFLRLAMINMQIRSGRFDLAQIERFIGITASDSATAIILPSLERFNDVLQILKNENRQAEVKQISASFFGRMLALERFEAGNFTGLSQTFFQQGNTEKAIRVLQLMADAGDEAKRSESLAEIAAIDVVKAKATDSKKLPDALKTNSVNATTALNIAAQLAAEFQQPEAAIDFRRRLLESDSANIPNQIELSKLLISKGERAEAENLLTQIINNRNALRPLRWQAKMILHDVGVETKVGDAKFDFFSQFYNALLAEKNGQNEIAINFFLNSLIAETADMSSRQELIKLYALSDQPYAALKLAEGDKFLKSDQMLQLLSETAEKISDFARAIDFEKAKSVINRERIDYLQQLNNEKDRRAISFTIDLENTRKL